MQALDCPQSSKGWPLGRLVVLDAELFLSASFLDLSKAAMLVLMRFLQKRSWDDGKRKKKLKDITYRKEDLVFIAREAKWMGISESSFRRAIRELVEHGFIEVAHQGGAYGPKKDPSRYRLVDTWRTWKTESFPYPKKQPCGYSGSFDRYNQTRKRAIEVSAKNDCKPIVKNDCGEGRTARKGVHK